MRKSPCLRENKLDAMTVTTLLALLACGILVLALGSGAGKGSDREAALEKPAAPQAGVPTIDANAPAETHTATFALG